MQQQITPTIKPTYKQSLAYELLWDDIVRFLLFGGGAEGGKSWLGAEWLLTNCYRYPGTKWFIGRNELTRLMASSYQTFRKVCVYHDIPPEDWTFNGQYHYIQFKNGSRIDLLDLKFSPTDPMFQRYGSTEYTGGWIEEAGEVHFLAFDVLKGRVGRWKNKEYNLFPKILLTCNPEQNWLYRIFYKPYKKNTLPKGYAFIPALYKDNPYTSKEAESRLEQITDPILRARLKLGLWEYAKGDNSLIDYDSIVDLFTNSVAVQESSFFTADVARYGSDKITLGSWKGLNLYKITWKQNRSIPQTSEDIKIELRDGNIPYSHAIADDDGVGGGVVDIVKGIKGFVGNSTPIKPIINIYANNTKKENYRNLRSQCGFILATKIKNHEIAISAKIDEITKEMIIEDLQQIKKKETSIEAPLQLIPKEEVKEALGRSPDFSDMMLMRMYFEVDKPENNTWKPNDPGGIKPLYPELGIY
jgi:hypothetical protein